ncbi:MAG: 4-hydroxy-3-methylbut-2-enyl diphosphate reductase [Bacteroidia bacterium]|nr:4-hydroxy-3-methylbut-2-enyl diphosphate reductase [Bacteroidia bacterium]MBP7270485.1 4-hydroxy-3-methylbut-2-enyl diphosphate reductase [Bacteroidia bacterium]
MKITLDPHSGFCFGVVYAIQMAEDELNRSGSLYCLGDIVHNNVEVERLKAKGLKIIDHAALRQLHDCKVLIRAHGEPPETYQIALKNNIELIDASCPVVLKLQNRVRTSYEEVVANNGQVVIYGEIGHAEVNGLVGQTAGEAIIVRNEDDINLIDFSRPIYFFSQTTKSSNGFERMKALIEERSRLAQESEIQDEYLSTNDTICRQVSNREPQLRKFAEQHDLILFVSGKKSSNGKALFEVCRSVNPKTYFISDVEEIDYAWFEGVQSVGICGATSTPMWLMQKVASHLEPIATTA